MTTKYRYIQDLCLKSAYVNLYLNNITYYFIYIFTHQNSIPEEIKSRLRLGNTCYHSVQNLLSSRLLSKYLKTKMQNYNFAGCFVWV